MKNTTITSASKTDAKEVKFYLIDGVKFATASNWRTMGAQPRQDGVTTVMTTKQGFEFNIFAESETEAYDAEAHAKATEKRKELKKQQSELFKLYVKHDIGLVDYTTEMARIEKELA